MNGRVFAGAWLLGGVALVGTIGCAKQAVGVNSSSWGSTIAVDHPLVGSWWHVAEGRTASREEVSQLIAESAVLLVGEKHDNADHHAIQAELVAEHLAHGGSGAVLFEMLDDPAALEGVASAEALAEAVAWADSGWPDFAIYQPIFEAAFGAGAAVLAANPPEEILMGVMREGYDSIPEEYAIDLDFSSPLGEEELASLTEEIVDAHCGHAPSGMIDMMVRGQRVKDAWMAMSMERSGADRVALIAGAGHTRPDRGVPRYLSDSVGEGVLVVHALEVSDEGPLATDYEAEGAHLLYFTPRVDSFDPCEAFREQLEGMGQ